MRTCIRVSVVVLILLLVSGLLFAALGRLQEAQNRATCSNNLRQIGVSIHNYHASMGWVPQATIPNGYLPAEQRLSWTVALLPYIECDNLYTRIMKRNGGAWNSPEHAEFLRIDHRVFRCPLQQQLDGDWPSSYVGVAGVGEDAAYLPLADRRCGVFGHDRRINLKDIADGESNTVFALETTRTSGPWIAGGPHTVRGVILEDLPFIGNGAQFGRVHLSPWRARWCGVSPLANALRGDASGMILRHPDEAVIRGLVTIAGGEPPPGEDY